MLPQGQRFFSETLRKGFEEGRAAGKADGRAEGRVEGQAEGRVEGRAEGKAEAILLLVEQRGWSPTTGQREAVLRCADASTLDRWLKRALTASSLDELLA